ncbi:MAG: PKD domain-containing protein, partial [Gemmatimonadota bacterium]
MNVRPSLNRALLFGAATLIAAACGRDPQLPTDTEPTTAEVQPAAGDVATALVVHRRHTPDLMKIEGVVGTGLGVDGEKPRIRVYTVHGNVRGIPDHVDNVPIERVVTGLILAGDINNPASRERPAPNGFSIGHPDITAGTMGAIVRDTDDVCYALSNNHVLANSNDASIGDNALQPGPADGGSDPTDAIGTLADFEPISFSSDNEMDAAIAELFDPASVTGSTPDYAYGAPGTSTVNPSVGLDVQKFGRTTAHTTGDVAEIDVTVSVCYVTRGPFNCASAATFVDQFTITPGSFSDGGDSGSLIVTDNDDAANPVGLLFAGSDTRTIANPIGPVLGRFGVVIEPNTANCGGDGGDPPANQPPTADFSFSADGLAVDFTDESSDSDGSVVSWSWDFGDGNDSADQNPSHTYDADGDYTVTLTVTDDDGATDDVSQTVTVDDDSDPPANEAPTADFSFSADGLTVDFTDESSDSDGSVVAWSWDFGDGGDSAAENPSHTYDDGGTYTVTL